MTECDHKIEELLMAYAAVMNTDMSRLVKSKKAICKKNAVDFDVEKYGYAIREINPMSIPGMSAGSVLQLIGELGHNFVDMRSSANGATSCQTTEYPVVN